MNPQPEITVCIPAHPARVANGMLDRAIRSVNGQSLSAAAISVAIDLKGEGAAPTRQRALVAARTAWVAFLDSDDWFYPEHLEVLATEALAHDAEYVFSYYTVHTDAGDPTNCDPLGHFGKQFDPASPHQTTITTLVRTDLAQAVGFRTPPKKLVDGQRHGEDFQFTLDCVQAQANFLHVPRRTWAWVHHGNNTSGLPTQGDARQGA
ncbi:glycosyltransferase family 2 protein [Streptomyces kronopolitis]